MFKILNTYKIQTTLLCAGVFFVCAAHADPAMNWEVRKLRNEQQKTIQSAMRPRVELITNIVTEYERVAPRLIESRNHDVIAVVKKMTMDSELQDRMQMAFSTQPVVQYEQVLEKVLSWVSVPDFKRHTFENVCYYAFQPHSRHAYTLAAYATLLSDRIFRQLPDSDKKTAAKDVYRHAYWAAAMTKYLGGDVALAFLMCREMVITDEEKYFSVPENNDAMMDMLNNHLGIAIGLRMQKVSMEDIGHEILKNMQSGGFFILR